ncbi:MAG TPA: hypothetical protein PKV41_03415 [Candidatus Omnitrophota bacterium]|nr:hypothetical protein [Candidatus Omnitrophota bacterium]
MIYLFLGENGPAKKQQIAKIQESCALTGHALKFDYEPLYAEGLNADVLKKALLALPALAQKRLVLIRNAEELDEKNQRILLEFIKADHARLIVILETRKTDPKDDFLKKIAVGAKVMQFAAAGKTRDIWDATRAIERRHPAEALEIVNELMEDGEVPVKILGALIWFWGKCKGRVTAERFKKGLLVLQEADLNIKRSRLRAEYAIEAVVTNLSLLIGG